MFIMENDLIKNELARARNRQIDILEKANGVLDKIIALRVHENDQLGLPNDFLDRRGKLIRRPELSENMFKQPEKTKGYTAMRKQLALEK
jgi:hypothetical protein